MNMFRRLLFERSSFLRLVNFNKKLGTYVFLKKLKLAGCSGYSIHIYNMVTSKVEVLVDWADQQDEVAERTLKKLRSLEGVERVEVREGALLVESTLPSSLLLSEVEAASGRRAVLQGFGDNLSAVVQVGGAGVEGVIGAVRLQQSGPASLLVDGAVDGLPRGRYRLRVHEAGDLSQGCESLGGVYGGEGGAGELGVIVADDGGRAVFRLQHQPLKLSEIIGRSLAISPERSSSGDGDWTDVKNVGCGIIARSAGVFTNAKRVCACDGVVVWEERARPAAGRGRRAPEGGCCGKHRL